MAGQLAGFPAMTHAVLSASLPACQHSCMHVDWLACQHAGGLACEGRDSMATPAMTFLNAPGSETDFHRDSKQPPTGKRDTNLPGFEAGFTGN